jgi:hypothetical protein
MWTFLASRIITQRFVITSLFHSTMLDSPDFCLAFITKHFYLRMLRTSFPMLAQCGLTLRIWYAFGKRARVSTILWSTCSLFVTDILSNASPGLYWSLKKTVTLHSQLIHSLAVFVLLPILFAHIKSKLWTICSRRLTLHECECSELAGKP